MPSSRVLLVRVPINRDRLGLTDDRLKAAVAFGFGATQEEAAEFCGKSVSTAKRHKEDPVLKQISEAIAAYKSIQESKQVKSAVSEAIESAEERIKRLFDKATRLTERAVQKVEDKGDEATVEELMEMHKQITVWASKYTASEAPKRLQVEGSVQHEHKHFLPYSEVKRAILVGKEIDENFGRPLIAGESDVIDAEAVS